MSTPLSDRDLITQVLQGNQQSFAVLVERYRNMVFTVAYRLVNNREDAEELAQSAFVKAYRSLADYRGDAKFSTWLYTIVSSLGLSFLRKKRVDTLSMSHEKVQVVAESAGGGFSANTIEIKSRVEMVQKAIGMLGPDDAQVLTLFYKGEQTLDEIGRIMGIDPNTAKVKLHRARTRLKKLIETKFTEELIHL
ncbi:MAG: sigma-70 family RNA polymerase sigma factor [Chitinophagaceae bacterium]|jgi:RNA polymerase sigma-70 factor (ECF subfamily)|nr:sigma-70 family RNA polymerase sigma factor [Chitinophagaceae bacterium]